MVLYMFLVISFPKKKSYWCFLNMITGWNISIFLFLYAQNYRLRFFQTEGSWSIISAVREQKENNLIMSLTLSWDKFPLEFGHKADELSGLLLGIFEVFSLIFFFWFTITSSIMTYTIFIFFSILKTTGDTREQKRSL